MILICHFSNHYERLFDGDATVALVADKAAEIAGLSTHTEVEKSSTEAVDLK